LPGVSGAIVPAFAAVSLVAEVSIPLLLLIRPTRPLGLVLGAIFHLLIGARMPHISSFVFALYVPFLPSPVVDAVLRLAAGIPGVVRYCIVGAYGALFTFIHLVTVFAVVGSPLYRGAFTVGRRTWLVSFTVVTIALVVVLVRARRETEPTPTRELSLHPAGIVATGLLVLNGLTPYLGLKTQLAFTMYSNLRTEGDAPNHAFMPAWLRVLRNEEPLVEIVSSDLPDVGSRDGKGSAPFYRPTKSDGPELWPKLQLREWIASAYATGQRGIHLTYVEDGTRHATENAETDPNLTPLPGALTRKLLAFRPVSRGPHQKCFW
jgi:hypothetical protein